MPDANHQAAIKKGKNKDKKKANKKNNNPCVKEGCDCVDPSCDHKCCKVMRERVRVSKINVYGAALKYLPEGSPCANNLMGLMKEEGYKGTYAPTADLAQAFDDASTPVHAYPKTVGQHGSPADAGDPYRSQSPSSSATTISIEHPGSTSSAISVLGDSMRKSLQSQEREHKLNRLIASIPALEKTNHLSGAMAFLYRTQCEATADDFELAIQAAVCRCSVQRFNKILRAASKTKMGWENACNQILDTISKHFIADTKTALTAGMIQLQHEGPAEYADRVMSQMDIYIYFAGINNKTVDEPELARAWVQGLDSITRALVSVAVDSMKTYTISDALGVARIAFNSTTSIPTTARPPLQALDNFTAPEEPMMIQQIMEGAAPSLQTIMDAAVAQMDAKITANGVLMNAKMDERLAAMNSTQAGRPAGMGLPTRYPCKAPECGGALHRWDDCPVKRPCEHCSKHGHHSESCFTLAGNQKFVTGAATPTRPRATARDRSPDRDRDSGRDRGRGRDRDRDRVGSRSTSNSRGHRDSGRRLNGRGR